MRLARTAIWLAALGYGLLLVAGAEGGFPERSPTTSRMPYLADKPIGEDGYYMLTIAWHLGNGQGLTYNADGSATGIQPLSTILYSGVAAAVVAAGGDRWTFARAMFAVGILQWLLLAAIVMRLTAAMTGAASAAIREMARPLAGLLTLLCYHAFRMSTYALETPLYLMLFCGCVWLTLQGTKTVGAAVRLGVMAGFTVLARIDFLVVLAIFLGLEMLYRRLPIRLAMLAGVTAALVASPWFATVYAISGHVMPSSGRAQSHFPINAAEAFRRIAHMADALAQQVSPWLYFPAAHTLVSAVTGMEWVNSLLTLLMAVAGALVVRRGWQALPADTARPIASWLVALGMLFGIYTALFWPVFFYVRYSAPLIAISFPLIAVGLSHGVSDRRAWAAAPIVLLAGFTATAWVTLHTGRIGNSHSISAGHVARKLPPPAVVGAYQSGVVGYFNPNVVNLDGKVNSAVLEASANGTFPAYVKARGLTHVVDWPFVAAPGSYFSSWPDCGLGHFGYSLCLVRPNP